MDIKDFRKIVFLNSQYCTYYISENCTVLAGIMRSIGYKFGVKLPDEKIVEIEAVYRKFTTLMNCIVGIEILLYVYLFIFPNFLKLMAMPYFIMALVLSMSALVMLYLTYIVVNGFYENYLKRYVGTFKKVDFKPTIYNVEPKAFERYINTPKKSIYVLLVIIGIFLYYFITPFFIDSLVFLGKYNSALSFANIYSKFIPISSDVYAQRAYAKFQLKRYEDAVNDYKLANDYSGSNSFDIDIFGVETYFLPFDEVIAEFDGKISQVQNDEYKQFYYAEKANYLLKNKKYKEALDIYNKLIELHKKGQSVSFAIDEMYHNRGLAKSALGDYTGGNVDKAISKKMCQTCEYNLDSKFVKKP